MQLTSDLMLLALGGLIFLVLATWALYEKHQERVTRAKALNHLFKTTNDEREEPR